MKPGKDAPENQYWHQNGIQLFLSKKNINVEKLLIFDKIGNVRPKFLGNSETTKTLRSIQKRMMDLRYLKTGMVFEYNDEIFTKNEFRLSDINCKVRLFIVRTI